METGTSFPTPPFEQVVALIRGFCCTKGSWHRHVRAKEQQECLTLWLQARAVSLSAMQVLVVCPYVPHPAEHGGRIRSRLFVETLAAHHEVDVAACIAGDADGEAARALTAALGVAVHALPARLAPRASLAGKLGCWLRGRSELLRRRWAAAAPARLRQLLAMQRYDCVVADSTFVAPLLPVSIDVPIVQQLPNVEYAALARPGAERGLAARASRSAEARVLRRIERTQALRARLTITASQTDRAHLLAIAPQAAVEVVENSVDLERLPQLPVASTAAPLLLFVGSFDYPPNAEAMRELIDHLPALRAARPGLRVRCIGAGLGGELATAARAAAIETPGHVADLLPHYREATAVYLPIRSGGGTRIKVLEALAVGRPVLSTRIGVEGLGLAEGRDYLSCETAEAGARSLLQLAGGAAGDMVARGRALAEARYCHAVVRQRIVEVFARLAAEQLG